MWKTAKARWAAWCRLYRAIRRAVAAWWVVFLAGPDYLDHTTERALRRIFQAHEARFVPQPDHALLTIHFTDPSERTVHGTTTLPAFKRTPQLTFQGRQYTAVRFEDGTWIYRQLVS